MTSRSYHSLVPKRAGILLTIICVLYTVAALVLLWQLGALGNLAELVLSTPDARTYLELSNFLVGRTATINPELVAFRPFVFPLFLSLYHVIGPYGFFVFQLLLNVVSVGLVFLTVYSLTDSSAMACLAALLLVSSPTFTLSTPHALTMPLAVFFLSSALLFLALYFRRGGARLLHGALFTSSIAVCIKPIFLPFFLLCLGFVAWTVLRHGGRPLGVAIFFLLLALAPVLLQVAFSTVLTGRPSISSVGTINFVHRFFPAVYGFATQGRFVPYSDPVATRAGKECPALRSKVRFITEHPAATLRATIFLLRHNLFSGTPFAGQRGASAPEKRLAGAVFSWSRFFNRSAAVLHGVAIVALAWLVLVDGKNPYLGFFLLDAALVESVLILSVLSYWQGDRIITAALPAWAVLYPALAYHVARTVSPTARA